MYTSGPSLRLFIIFW